MDYSYPSIFFSYFLFFLLAFGALFFFIRSVKHGYWGRRSEEAKYRMLEDEDSGRQEPGPRDRRTVS
jgi:hypothetical protein